jgi:hypothetical protein
MRDQTARNLVALLQMEPLAYRHFGYYWWYVKLELKRAGFDRDQLPALGDYTDARCEAWYKTQRPSDLLQAAIEHQQSAAFLSYLNNTHAAPVSAGGGVYVVYDGDVE